MNFLGFIKLSCKVFVELQCCKVLERTGYVKYNSYFRAHGRAIHRHGKLKILEESVWFTREEFQLYECSTRFKCAPINGLSTKANDTKLWETCLFEDIFVHTKSETTQRFWLFSWNSSCSIDHSTMQVQQPIKIVLTLSQYYKILHYIFHSTNISFLPKVRYLQGFDCNRLWRWFNPYIRKGKKKKP